MMSDDRSRPEIAESTWRNRFILVNMTRIGGTAVVIFGLIVWQTDTLREGGSALGFPIAILGLIASFGGPIMLARRWRTPPGQ